MIEEKAIPLQTLKRMSIYLHYLEDLYDSGVEYVSTPKIAQDLCCNEMSVKKDLAYITTENGKPKVGHKVINLINDLKEHLGYNNTKTACLVGVGNLGRALLGYKGFAKYGLEIVVAFDSNPDVVGTQVNGIRILDSQKLANICSRMSIPIGIITVGSDAAQEVCDTLVLAGVKAIWNFAPTHLRVPEGIAVQNENMASSLAILSSKINTKL